MDCSLRRNVWVSATAAQPISGQLIDRRHAHQAHPAFDLFLED